MCGLKYPHKSWKPSDYPKISQKLSYFSPGSDPLSGIRDVALPKAYFCGQSSNRPGSYFLLACSCWPISMTGWWFGTSILFSHILGIIIAIDVHIFQRGGPTTNQISMKISVKQFKSLHLFDVRLSSSYKILVMTIVRWQSPPANHCNLGIVPIDSCGGFVGLWCEHLCFVQL